MFNDIPVHVGTRTYLVSWNSEFYYCRPLVEEKLELEKLAMEKIKNAQNSVSGDHYIWIQYM